MSTYRTLVAAALSALIANAALATDYTFDDGGADADWGTAQNWFPDGVPGATDNATVGSGFNCFVTDDESVAVLTVEDGGTLSICTGRKLTVHADSTVNGSIEFGCKNGNFCDAQFGAATLEIYDDLTISTGASEEGDIWCRCVDGVIAAAPGSDAVLSLEASEPMLCYYETCKTIRVDPGNGFSIDVQIELINHGKVGCSGDSECEVSLSSNAKSGCGYWYARDGGTLVVAQEVSGNANWFLEQADASTSVIAIDTSPVSLTGNVFIDSGTLDINVDFCTTGDLLIKDGREQDAVIDVAANKVAKFGATCG